MAEDSVSAAHAGDCSATMPEPAMSSVLQGRVGGRPASQFLEEGFDSRIFVAKARRAMPLDDLLAELQTHLLKLRESLVDTINQDYTAFVGMASNLRGLDEALGRVRSPLENLRSEVDELRGVADHAVKQLEAKLGERQSAVSARRRLELLLDVEQGLQRMEALLLREISSAGTDAADLEEAGAYDIEGSMEAQRAACMLERIANEAARLKGQVWRLNDEGAVSKKDMMGRVQQLHDRLITQTNSIFGRAVNYRNEGRGRGMRGAREAMGGGSERGGELEDDGSDRGSHCFHGREALIQSCWRVYMVCERSDDCQAVLRREAVRPFVAETVTVKALEGSEGAPGSCQGLEQVYERVIWFVDGWCLPLCALAQDAVGTQAHAADDWSDATDRALGAETAALPWPRSPPHASDDSRHGAEARAAALGSVGPRRVEQPHLCSGGRPVGEGTGTMASLLTCASKAASVMTTRSFFLAHCLFAELSSVLLSVGGRRVMQYLDPAFCKKYRLTMGLLRELELRCRTRHEARALREHVAMVDFVHKWELPLRAYTQLKTQEVSKAMARHLLTPASLAEAYREKDRLAPKHAQASGARAPGTGAAGNGVRWADTAARDAPAASVEEADGSTCDTCDMAAMSAHGIPYPALASGLEVLGTSEGLIDSISVKPQGAYWHLQCSQALWDQVDDIWVDPRGREDLIPALSAKMLHLTAMLIAKYCQWASDWAQYLEKNSWDNSSQAASATASSGAASVSSAGGPARTDNDVDKDLRLIAALCHDCWRASARVASEKSISEPRGEPRAQAPHAEVGAPYIHADSLVARGIVDALVAAGARDGWLPQELHCNHLMSFPRGLVVVAAASTAASKRCGSMCPSEPSGIEFVCNLLGGCTMCDSPLAEDRVVRLVDESLSPCRDKLCSALACLQQVLVKALVARAAEPLIAVRAVTSKYRMTNTPAPTAPSLYVRGVTQPLRRAISETWHQSSAAPAEGRSGGRGCLTYLSEGMRAEVLSHVVTGVAAKYTELVVEVFANVKRLGQTLKKLQKGSASSVDGGMSDDEKIYLQGEVHVGGGCR